MLKYSIRLTDDNIKQEEIVWREKYLAPDLSFVSGVTSQDYHLEKLTMIPSSNSISHTPNSIIPIETENVTREGFAVIKGKEYPIEKVNFNGKNYSYVFLNGKYYYSGDTGFIIDKWLSATTSGAVEVSTVASSDNSDTLKLDTIAWIEDDIVTIDSETYIYDFDLNGLRREWSDSLMDASAITKCDDISCSAYTDTSAYTKVTKFVLTKDEEIAERFENISFIKYFYYILYKNNYIYIYKNQNDEFVCDVPNLIDDSATTFSAYTDVYNEGSDTATPKVVSGDTFDVLRENECYVTIEDGVYNVQGDILNANDGSEIGVYLEDSTYNVDIGDVIRLVDVSDYNDTYKVYSEGNDLFVVFKNGYYKVIPNLCDKVEIEGNEYNIEYINGKINGKDCVVHIDDDITLSMTINVDNDTTKLIQKGLIVSGNSAVTMSYNINSYSGITVGVEKYPVIGTSENEYYVNVNETNEYQFIVTDIIGSSLLVCRPYLNNIYFSNDFIKELSRKFCEYVVENQRMMALYFKNNIFGKREITNTLGLEYDSGATSSNDYFNLFDNFSIYSPNAYIHIPLELSTPQGGNPLQDDLINEEFFKNEREKAINPIIDMEKDVYTPKYMNSGDIDHPSYSGSDTDFHELQEIRFNLHFRTRNLDSWKVNEDYNDVSTSGLCNWFITDFYPYSSVTDSDKLLNSSDLVGLLYFTNNDIYYQKSKVAKSFLRLSFYDSVDQQTQMLLGTSTVFMDEHKLFKKFIDNSKKELYNNQFVIVEEEYNSEHTKINKISVNAEYTESGSTRTTPLMDDDHRLGSEFIIKNKYETESSSEGYYLYMFREYSEKLTPKPIYMKVEFNHAGIGRTIPFIVPMRWSNADDDGYKTPVSALTLSNVGGDNSDLSILKNGIKLEDSYMQTYIPLYAVYDFKNKQYAYVFDERYVNIDRKEGKVTINLFEIKFAEDTKDDDDIKKKITYGKQPTANIDINKKMFGDKNKECD